MTTELKDFDLERVAAGKFPGPVAGDSVNIQSSGPGFVSQFSSQRSGGVSQISQQTIQG